MKLIRLTDDTYVFDAGEVKPQELEAINAWFKKWFTETTDVPRVMVIGGWSVPLEYEDRRTSDLEARVKRLEEHRHAIGRNENSVLESGPPTQR